MADGLRLLSTCPRCGTGTLVFRDGAEAAPTAGTGAPATPAERDERAPHLVLGVPRR